MLSAPPQNPNTTMPKRTASSISKGFNVCDMRSGQPSQTSITNFFLKKKKPRVSLDPQSKRAPPQSPPPNRNRPKSPPTPKRSNQKKKKQTQLYLDFGQRNFGRTNVCTICGMLVVHGVPEDIARHERFCQDFQEGVSYNTDTGIIQVEPSRLRQKMQQVQAIVNQELGFVEDTNAANTITTYWYIRQKRIVGLLRVQRIEYGYAVLQTTPSLERSNVPQPCVLGIHQIWVHAKHRHNSIASQLVDHARQTFSFGYVIPNSQIAFSSPTQDGLAFAQRYNDNHPVLVYDCGSP